MADELKAVLDQLKTDIDAITGSNKVQLGQLLTAIPEATHDKFVAAISMRQGVPSNDTYTATSESHLIDVRVYFRIKPELVEKVEQAVASVWDLFMEKFFDGDGNRNLSSTCTVCLIGGEEGTQFYQCGYELVGGKLHRVLIFTFEVILDTHEVT